MMKTMIAIFITMLCSKGFPADDAAEKNSSAVLQSSAATTQALEMLVDKWVGPFPISGKGVDECGESVAKAIGWDICSQKAKESASITGLDVSVVDMRLEGYWRKDEWGPWYDHWHKCYYGANVFCLIRTNI